ncbi:MAG TPA: ATP-binding protein [Bacteroidia bacterium]|nr:ATP-binding protein [Bacteroidia bacterium]
MTGLTIGVVLNLLFLIKGAGSMSTKLSISVDSLFSIVLHSQFGNYAFLFIAAIIIILLLTIFIFRREIRKIETRKEQEALQQSTKLKEQFLANMSHEFRTPLNAIVGMTRLLRDNDPKPEQMNYLNAIKQSSESLMAIINDMLDISKIEAGRIQLTNHPFELRAICESVYNNFQLRALEKKLDYTVHVDENVPEYLSGDPLRLLQILSNVVDNAIKFTEAGSVSLHCSVKENVQNSPNDVVLLFKVTDTGIGISDSSREKIFESFSQESSDTTREYGGAGLGLSVTRKLLELYGGTIDVSSKTGYGSVFKLMIPFEIYRGKSLQKIEISNSQDLRNELKGISVLLVEDIEFNRIVAIDTLMTEIEGVEVDVAANGNEAVAMAGGKVYDVILMDLQMPELNGYDASRQIRMLEKPHCETPIVAMTASALEDEIYRCYEAGMNDFINKPFDTEMLFKKILNQMHKSN